HGRGRAAPPAGPAGRPAPLPRTPAPTARPRPATAAPTAAPAWRSRVPAGCAPAPPATSVRGRPPRLQHRCLEVELQCAPGLLHQVALDEVDPGHPQGSSCLGVLHA